MPLDSHSLLLVTGATGLVGRHVVDRALAEGVRVRALVRDAREIDSFQSRGVEVIPGSLTDAKAVQASARQVTHVVHCAARVGDWGPIEEFRDVNVRALESLVAACLESGSLQRFVHISSLGVFPAHDHYGTDETAPVSSDGIDGYTLSKVEAEGVVRSAVESRALPAVILRPGFIYGRGDRSVLPRLLERLKSGQFRYLGDRTNLMNNTWVGNLVDAIFLALGRDDLVGQIFNITDGRLVTKEEFVTRVCDLADLPHPTRTVPLGVARVLASVLETVWRWRGKAEAPILSKARIKFLGLNLDFCIDKARRELGYNPEVDFHDAMQRTLAPSSTPN